MKPIVSNNEWFYIKTYLCEHEYCLYTELCLGFFLSRALCCLLKHSANTHMFRSSQAGRGQQAALLECEEWFSLFGALGPINPTQSPVDGLFHYTERGSQYIIKWRFHQILQCTFVQCIALSVTMKFSYETWGPVFDSSDTDSKFNCLLNTCLRILYSSFPLMWVKNGTKNSTWTISKKHPCTGTEALYRPYGP